MRAHSTGELEVFQAGVNEHIAPLADSLRLKFETVDQELCALVGDNFFIKFYCAGGHGYSLTVTMGPTFSPVWNDEAERGIVWLLRYKREDPSIIHDRYDSPQSFSNGIAVLAKLLPDHLDYLSKSDDQFWVDFYNFVESQIVSAPEPPRMKYIEKLRNPN